jgi:hypothetical protein
MKMNTNNILKHVRFSQTHVDILEDLMEQTVGINSYAEAIRYAVLCLADQVDNENEIKKMSSKMNAMSKNIDVLVEMTAGGFHEQEVTAIGKSEDTYIYMDAKKNVENKIQRATTMKSNRKASNIYSKQKEDRVKEKVTEPIQNNATRKPRFTL